MALSAAQLISWGVWFYAFPLAAPAITAGAGWSPAVLSLAFSGALLVAGLAAPAVAALLRHRGGRTVLTAGSMLGLLGMVSVAVAPTPAVLLAGLAIVGLAMAATLHEPAMAILVTLDPARRQRSLATVTVAGGLASTVFAPLTVAAVDRLGWRVGLAGLAVAAGSATAALHLTLPPAGGPVVADGPTDPGDHRVCGYGHLRLAQLLEQSANLAVTASFVAMLTALAVPAPTAAVVLGTMGLGKVAGRLALLGPVATERRPALAAACNLAQVVALAIPFVTTATPALVAAAVGVGAASGATTVLRPLLVVDLVGADAFAATNARIQRAAGLARAAGPAAVGIGAATIGWAPTWAFTLGLFIVAADRYRRIDPTGC
jgi:MFS family permease